MTKKDDLLGNSPFYKNNLPNIIIIGYEHEKSLFIGILAATIILSGCGTSQMAAGDPNAVLAGAAIGSNVGGAIGGLIGDSNGGWRGGYRGSAIGTIIGTIAGAAIANAATAPKSRRSTATG